MAFTITKIENNKLKLTLKCVENSIVPEKNHMYFSTILCMYRCGNRPTAGGKPHLLPNVAKDATTSIIYVV